MSKRCPRCGLDSEDAATFCRGCGEDLRLAGWNAGASADHRPPSGEQPPPPPDLGPPTAPPPPGFQYANLPPSIPTNLLWAILATVLCCVPLGIVSIVYSAQVNQLLLRGDIPAAQRASRLARNWALASVAIAVVSWIVYALLVVAGGAGMRDWLRHWP